MTVEIQMLAWSVALGLVQILLAAALMTHQRGLKWNTGARDGQAAWFNEVYSAKPASLACSSAW